MKLQNQSGSTVYLVTTMKRAALCSSLNVLNYLCSVSLAFGFHLNIVEVILDQNPLFGLTAAAPALDVAFERCRDVYPVLMANTTRYRIYKPQNLLCVDAAGLVLSAGGEILDLVESLTGFTVFISPGTRHR